MTPNFAQLFEECLKETETRPGSIIKGTVIAICKDNVTIDAGLRSHSIISIDQFKNSSGEIEVIVGDEINVALDATDDGFGETILSREKAKRHESWQVLTNAYEEGKSVVGVINGKVKGGYTVEILNIRAFLPISLLDTRAIQNTSHLEGKDLEFRVIKLDQKRNNVVVSRRAVLESLNTVNRVSLFESLHEGKEVKGTVKNITDFGAFVDLGGIDGLLHISEMTDDKAVKHPNEVLKTGRS